MEQNNPPESTNAVDTQFTSSPEEITRQRRIVLGIVGVTIITLALLITSLIFLFHPNTQPEQVARIRDIFIILMALESLVIGLVLVILIVQIARLTNLLQNEVKPILDSTNETISTLRGTTAFLSDNLVEPVIKLNEYIASLQRLISMLGFGRKRK